MSFCIRGMKCTSCLSIVSSGLVYYIFDFLDPENGYERRRRRRRCCYFVVVVVIRFSNY